MPAYLYENGYTELIGIGVFQNVVGYMWLQCLILHMKMNEI